jgi:hypothetical protein
MGPWAEKAIMSPKVSKALHAMRLYLGSVDFASVKDQQRLFDRAKRAAENVTKETGIRDAWDLIQEEALKRGVIRPIPGQHI